MLSFQDVAAGFVFLNRDCAPDPCGRDTFAATLQRMLNPFGVIRSEPDS